MTAILMPGAPVADAVMADVADRVAKLKANGVTPGLGTILVGDDPASAGYVRKKHEACEAIGMNSFHCAIPADHSQDDLLQAIADWNANDDVHGFLLQNPVPRGFDFNAAMTTIDPRKDADGLHPLNLGLLALGAPGPRPCTPVGIVQLLAHYQVPVAGRHVVVVGRGPTLGRPLSMLLALKDPLANAAVTTVHTGVPNWADYTRQADIVVGAAGVPNMIQPEHVRPGACVIGGGMTWEGRKAFSDVSEEVGEVAGWITPRLGGVGVTTVALLLRNTVEACERQVAGG